MEYVAEHEKCTGCSACVNICPQGCICMAQGEDGFYYPTINQGRCVGCNLCRDHCPAIQEMLRKDWNAPPIVCAFQNASQTVRKDSTSGGFFSTVAEEVIGRGGIVCAVGFDDRANILHRLIADEADIAALRGSKYVQSRLTEQFAQIGGALRRGQEVLFVGTPCQVAGLYVFLRTKNVDRKRLTTVQLKCYGVSSPGLYEKYIGFLEQRYRKKVKEIRFRDKLYGYAASTVTAVFTDGTMRSNSYDVKTVTKSFFMGLNMRSSCFQCPFRQYENSEADFVIGDLHNLNQYAPQFDDDTGATLVYALSEKARVMLDQSWMKNITVLKNYEIATERNPTCPEERVDFMRDAGVMDWELLMNKYCPESMWDFFATKLKPLISGNRYSKKLFGLVKKINNLKYRHRTRA